MPATKNMSESFTFNCSSLELSFMCKVSIKQAKIAYVVHTVSQLLQYLCESLEQLEILSFPSCKYSHFNVWSQQCDYLLQKALSL